MPTYIKHIQGEPALDHSHAFESMDHAFNAITHLAEAGGKTNRSPSAHNFWPSLADFKAKLGTVSEEEAKHAAEVELVRRLHILLGKDGEGHGWAGDDRIFWAKRLLRELTAEHAGVASV